MNNSYEILALSDYQRVMPQFEKCNDGLVLPNMHLVLRADAHRYGQWPDAVSNYYPFHDDVVDCLIGAAAETMTQSGIKLNWCLVQGDEICYFFDTTETNNPRRRQELITLISSITSVAFSGLGELQAAFHSVLSELPTERHVLDFCMWQRLCWRRNAVSYLLAQVSSDAQTKMTKASYEEKMDFLQESGLSFDELPDWVKFGSAVWLENDGVSALKTLPDNDEEFISFCQKHINPASAIAPKKRQESTQKPQASEQKKRKSTPKHGPFRLGK